MTTGEPDMYQMSEEREKALWADCIFVFDTSALLSLYLYPEEARQQIYTEIFEKIKGRLWIPHHVLFEYLKNKASKIREPISRSYKPLNEDYIQPIVESFQKSLNRLDSLKNTIKNANSHPHMVAEEIENYERKLKEFAQTTAEFGRTFNAQMEHKVNEILLLEQHDTVHETIRKHFEVGRDYSFDEVLQISVEGKHRYEFKIPPGYEDLKDKIGTQIFGDLVIWKQLLEFAKDKKKNIVFVCNAVKEDWWRLVSDKKNEKRKASGPRRELVKEMKDHAGSAFWMYTQARFLDVANTLIKSNVLSRYIEEMSRLLVLRSLDKSLVYICDRCSAQNTLDTSTLRLNFEAVAADPALKHKVENTYLADDSFKCSQCGHRITAFFEVGEYPLGVISHQQTFLKGAALIRENPVEEERLLNEYTDLNSGVEEIVILDKKLFRLKAGKSRKILFKTPVDGNATLFQVDYHRPEKTTSHKRLLVEAYTAQKEKITKTLVLEGGVTRFVLRNEQEVSEHQFLSLVLSPNLDMTLALSVTEYPGSGHYLEKLYY